MERRRVSGERGGGLLSRHAMQPAEILASLLGLANIVLLVRRSLWNYPFGLAMVTIYAWVFAGARLYSDALLQLFFFVIQIYGWWAWVRAGRGAGEVPVVRLAPRARARWLVGAIAATLLWGWGMRSWTDAALPFWDAAIAVFSVVAQILLARRVLENWAVWIAVDAGAIALYAMRGLYLTAGLYILFLILAFSGLVSWARAERSPAEARG